MHVGLFAPSTPHAIDQLGPAAEARGFRSIWLPEHVLTFAGADQLILPALLVPEAELLPVLDRWADYLEGAQ
jgi:alkanesulfonate monooxygenase SsuD/methylene tetrahydromethanopterin reductase-like flavin-dependent oxidoreductase (luciferase family)